MSADPGLIIMSDVRNSLTHSSEGMSMDIKVARVQAAIITSSKRTQKQDAIQPINQSEMWLRWLSG